MKHNPFTRTHPKIMRLLFFLLIFLLIIFGFLYLRNFLTEKREISDAKKSVQYIPVIEEPDAEPAILDKTNTETPGIVEEILPESSLIKMPFTSQSPLAVWDTTQEDACEEASLIMVVNYLNKTQIGSKEEAERKILDLIDWENKKDYGPSITLNQLVQIAKDYYGMEGKVQTGISVEDIKREISAGSPVIIPAAGKILPNPNFRNGGPNYHMLVVKGYDKNGFITNDPGTRKGENFRYTYDDLFRAIHDWNPENILDGQKSFLIISK